MDVQRAVARNPRRPRVTRDLGTDRCRPGFHQRSEPRGRAEPRKLTRDTVADALDHAARTSPGRTSRSWAGSVGSAPRVVDVINVCA